MVPTTVQSRSESTAVVVLQVGAAHVLLNGELKAGHYLFPSSKLSWRDVQYLVVYTSNYSPLKSGGWKTNGAGLKFSHKFGFGAVDAEAMVTRARNWISVPAQQSCTIYPGSSG